MTLRRFRAPALSTIGSYALGGALAVSLLAVTSASATEGAGTACSPRTMILESPRAHSLEVQAKAINDRGDIVGFADSKAGRGPIHAILWKGGKAADAVDLGVLLGYVSSEAYGVNNRRVVFGLLYDKKERAVPFRWANGRMTVLTGPNGEHVYTDNPGAAGRNAINSRGEMAWTVIVHGDRRAIRWMPDGSATFLPALPGHAWTDAFSINDDGIVSGWSRKLPNRDGEENPVLWTRSRKVIALKTIPGRADGIAEATNRSGLTVGYLGNVGTDGIPGVANTDPERDNAVVWQSRTAKPRLLGRPAPVHVIEGLVDVNDRGQAAGMSGTVTNKGVNLAEPRIWRTGWTSLKPIRVPAESRKSNPFVATALNDINNRGNIVGTVYGLASKDYGSLRRIDPVLWTCAFGG
jgi:probable HAF family extracellular repeat protein